MLRKLAFGALMALLAATCSAQQTYASRTSTIRAGVLLLDNYANGNGQINGAPHVLYNLDQLTQLKPNGWIIDNPDHPGTLNGTAYTRWNNVDSPSPIAPGGYISKQDAAYWEVPLDSLSDSQIGDYDVLILPAHGDIQLTPRERERLRRFMDGGGVLWVDLNTGSSLDSGGTRNDDLVNGLPLPFEFGTGASAITSASFFNPILNFPNAISFGDMANMQGPGADAEGIIQIPSFGGADNIHFSIPEDSASLISIVSGTGATTPQFISVGQVGDGYEVVTTWDITTTINGSANQNDVGASLVSTTQVISAAKLAFNIMSLGNQTTSTQGGSTKKGSIAVDIGAPLLQEWTDFGSGVSPSYATSNFASNPPVVFKNMVLVSSNNQLLVYDSHPPESVTPSGPNFGNPDDGYQDYSLGAGNGQDLIWESSTFGVAPISPPTCITVNVGGTLVNEAWVVDSNGDLYGFDLDTKYSSGSGSLTLPPDASISKPDSSLGSGVTLGANSEPGAGPYAPTFQDGLLFVSENDTNTGTPAVVGRVWVADPSYPSGPKTLESTGGTPVPWQIGGITGGTFSGALQQISASPTVGYVPIQDGSGGQDRVLYVPFYSIASLTNPNKTAGIASYWLGAKGESPVSWTQSGSTLQIQTRCGTNIYIPSGDNGAILSLAPRLTMINTTTGLPLSETQTATYISSAIPTENGSGQINFTTSSAIPTTGFAFRIDYTIDWGQATTQDLRGEVNFPDDQTLGTGRRVLNNVVLGSNGMLYAVLSAQDPTTTNNAGGSFYALQEYGRGNFNVLTRWDLYDEYTQPLDTSNPNAATATVLPTVSNNDPLLQFAPTLAGTGSDYAGEMHGLTFISGPVLANGNVYVLGIGQTNATPTVRDTMLFAFKANPPAPMINLPNPIAAGSPILQSDETASSTKNIPNLPITYYYQATQGTTLNTINLSSLSMATTGYLGQTLSESQPIVIQQTGSANELVYPDQTGSTWSPLEWYTVLTGAGPSTPASTTNPPPFVSGNTIFIPTTSIMPNMTTTLLASASPGPWPSPVGMMYALNATIPSNDPGLVSDQHPWQKQLVSITAPSGQALNINSLSPNPDFLWPQFTGAENYNDIKTRTDEATLGGTSFVYSAAGGDGRFFATTDQGLFGFERADFLVADSNRVAKFDAAGNPLWSTDLSLGTGAADLQTVGNIHPLVSPSRAYPLSNGQIVVADPGGNRLAILDQTGRETRSFDSFTVDSTNETDGYAPGEPLTFAGPRDAVGFTSIVQLANNPFTDNAQAFEYWVHYIIADSGNRRAIEIVDRYAYNNTTNQIGAVIAYGVLYRHTPTSVSGGKYSYSCISRIYDPTLTAGNGYVDILGIGNPAPATATSLQAATSGTVGSGGIVLWYEGTTAVPIAAPTVISTVAPPGASISANTLYDTTSLYATSAVVGNPFDLPAVQLPTALPIGDLNSVTARYTTPPSGGAATLEVVYTDPSGVYEINPGTGGVLSTATWTVDWMLPRSIKVTIQTTPVLITQDAPVYSVMRLDTSSGNPLPTNSDPLDFRPTYAERLANGDILVVNGYMGTYRKNPTDPSVTFQGEVLELNPQTFSLSSLNLGFNTSVGTTPLIKYQLPPITGTRGLVAPVFAHRN
ncbi:MAG TPA: hypothetical protein VGL56_06675 [Fimbriimonadaceae bacterium]|jgi:hypothetical protein